MKAVYVRPVSTDTEGRQIVDTLIVADAVPSPLPTTGEGIPGLSENMLFAPFSILYVVAKSAATKLFIADESGHFIAQ